MRIDEALSLGQEKLSKRSEIPRREAEWLLAWLLEKERLFLLLNGKDLLAKEVEEKYLEALDQRENGKPLQYIIGTQEFMGLSFCVNPNVLIPRRDTECLVELIVEVYQSNQNAFRVSDLGSGSGAIGVSLAHFLPMAQVTCVDFSKGAIDTTQENAKRLLSASKFSEMAFVHGDMFEYLEKLDLESETLIVSNPPYIPSHVIQTLQSEVKDYEPMTALDGGEDGYDYYRRLVKEAAPKLLPEGWLVFEVGHDQAACVAQLFIDDGRYKDIQCYRDLQGILRMVGAHKK